MKGAINGMLFGWMPEEYVKHHHAKYYQQKYGASESE
jgi:cytochrome b subunit of formate dehydrogenase